MDSLFIAARDLTHSGYSLCDSLTHLMGVKGRKWGVDDKRAAAELVAVRDKRRAEGRAHHPVEATIEIANLEDFPLEGAP